MDPEERVRRREERRRQREEADSEDVAETNGPTENGHSNGAEDEEAERKRLAEEEKTRKRNAIIEKQRLEDEERAKSGEGQKPKKKLGGLMGKVSKGRKKEILQMIIKKARGDLQLEEQEAAAERAKYVNDNVKEKSVDSMSKAQLQQLCEALHEQLRVAEGEKFDIEIKVKRRDLQISNLKIKANETRGKFAMPTLKSTKK